MRTSWSIIIFLLASVVASACSCLCALSAQALSLKLPYLRSERFVVVQGYDSPPTHINKDEYAMDLSQDGCDAYGKPVAAAAAGTAMMVNEQGYNGGYGTELIIDHGNDLISRYAHMIPGTIDVGVGQPVRQGQVIGDVGDTGLVVGLACPEHPGTHLHFAMDIQNTDGSLAAYKPEPISGYLGITAGKWYLSDNSLESDSLGQVLGASIVVMSTTPSSTQVAITPSSTSSSSSIISVSSTPPIMAPANSGGVSVSSAPVSAPAPVATPTQASAASSTTVQTSTFVQTSTLDQILTSTQTLTLFEQLDDSKLSAQSWYDDNWYDLGTGFAGTLTSLTLEGKVSDVNYSGSHVAFQEYKDANYTAMVQQFDISDTAPFTPTMATATFDGLSILLKPYFYYRLMTVQDYQNRSVVLAGTNTTGTMMWDNFVYGTGRVESTSTFMPFIIMNGIAATSTLTPPLITTPSNLTTTFNSTALTLNLAWATSTDPDWPGNPLHYEVNYSTSTVLDDSTWNLIPPISLVFGNSYLIGVRAADDFGDVSLPATTTWNFPAGFAPYILSNNLNYADQEFWLSTTTVLSSIQLFGANFQTGARNPDVAGCSLSLIYSSGTDDVEVPSDNGFSGYGCVANPVFSFASTMPTLFAGRPYHWVFVISTGNPSTGATVQFYGTSINTAGGQFSDPSLVNARFVINGPSGVVFSN